MSVLAFIAKCFLIIFGWLLAGIGMAIGIEVGCRVYDAVFGTNVYAKAKAWVKDVGAKKESEWRQA